jgi:hypothetical protein
MNSLPQPSAIPQVATSPRPALPRLIRVIVESVRGQRQNAWVTIGHVAGEAEDALRRKAVARYRQLAGYACRIVAIDLYAGAAR